jgi:uracil-DNA glycosylase
MTRKDGEPGEIPAAVARYLRQRIELGAREFHLAAARPSEVLSGLARVRTGAPGAPALASRNTVSVTDRASVPDAAHGSGSPMATPAGPTQIGTGGGKADGELPDSLEEVATLCRGCTRCGLAETREHVVFADGNPEARVMVVGEAPGANEDATGLPFVGAAGKLLDLLLRSVGLSREDSVYICNVIKCRPPGNRNPTPDEIRTCSPWLLRQIDLVKPEVILAVGTFAGKLLTGDDATLGALRGRVHRYHGTPLVVTYHPAALLRNSGWTRATWEDLQLLRRVLDGEDQAT